MGYSNIKRFLATTLLIAFTAPMSFAFNEDIEGTKYNSSLLLTGDVKLTENNDTITLSLRDSDVKQVLRMFADKGGKNIIFHDSVSGKVTLDLVNTTINEAFGLVLQVTNLNYYMQGNTMIVMSNSAPENAAYSKQEMLVFPIKYVGAEKIASFLNKNVFSMKKAGLSSVEAATVNSATNELIVFGMQSDIPIIQKVIEQFDKEPYSKTFAVNHTTPAEMANMICNMLLPSRGIQSGGSENSTASPESSTASPESGMPTGSAADISNSTLKLGEGVVACSISASASGSVAPFDVQNLSIAYFPQRGTITLMGGSAAQATMIENFIKANDVKQPQAYLEISIVELNESGQKDFQNTWEMQSKHFNMTFDGQSTAGGTTLGNMYANYVPVTYMIPKFESGVFAGYEEKPGPALVSGTKLKWTLNYLIKNEKARVLANPKIMITNGQESVVDLTQDYIEKVTSEFLSSTSAGYGATGAVQRTYTIGDDLGIKVSLTPFISPKGYVTLNIKPEYSTIAGQPTANSATGSQDMVATLLSRRNLDLKNIRIKDGETLVIGGMIQEQETKEVHKIPFLGDLPILGPIFRSTSTKRSKAELVIMITPKILNDDEGTIADTL